MVGDPANLSLDLAQGLTGKGTVALFSLATVLIFLRAKIMILSNRLVRISI